MSKKAGREQLPSKKNYVYWDWGEYCDKIIKIFTDQSRFQIEKEMGDLFADSSLLTPKRLSVNEAALVIEYAHIDGFPVVELIESTELAQAEKIIRKICAWLVEFYSITFEKKGCRYILGDIHLRNFLYKKKDDSVYGIDFEECRPGRIESDAARLYVFILYYDPAFTPRKKALAACFWNTLSTSLELDHTSFREEVKRETAELLARRATNPRLNRT